MLNSQLKALPILSTQPFCLTLGSCCHIMSEAFNCPLITAFSLSFWLHCISETQCESSVCVCVWTGVEVCQLRLSKLGPSALPGAVVTRVLHGCRHTRCALSCALQALAYLRCTDMDMSATARQNGTVLSFYKLPLWPEVHVLHHLLSAYISSEVYLQSE